MKMGSGLVVVAFGIALLGMAVLIWVKPEMAKSFLRLFASSVQAHFIEQITRLVVGLAIIVFSPSMWWTLPFQVFGWILVVTAAGLMILPWQWHHRFAKWAIPFAIRHLLLYSCGAFALGALILYGASRAITN